MLCWVAQVAGWLGSHSYLRGPLWHAHEMIFGFAFAVIAGFLFTAVRNWTSQPTPNGASLAAIAALWLSGRLLVVSPFPLFAAAADTAFAFAVAAGIAVPLYASRSRRNYFFVLLLLALGAANLAFHLAMAGLIEFPVQRALQAGLDVVIIVMAIIAGRVLPMFTANAVPGTQPRREPLIEGIALGSLVLIVAADLIPAPSVLFGLLAVVAALSHAARLALWKPWRTAHKPILWILHASYAWIVIHLALRALSAFELVAASAAIHALTVGAIGGMTLGMMTRTARGHTGRPLETTAAETTAYVLVQLAAATRVLLPIAVPSLYHQSVVVSGLLWTGAFAMFVWQFAPILWQARIDGRPG